jgi:ribose transport system substrate-binding protein
MYKKLSTLFSFVVLMSLILTACTTPAAQTKKLVYYFAPSLSDEFQAVSNDLMVKFGQEKGYEVKALNAVVNATTQVSQIEDALGQKPAAIILNAVDTATISSTVEKAKKAGVAVFVYDRFIKDTKTDFHSVVGTIKIGEMAAGEAVKLLTKKYSEEKGTILELMGDSGDSYSVMVNQGFDAEMKKHPNIKLIVKDTPGWETTTSATIVDDQFTANKNIDLIFVHGDFRAPAITTVLEKHGFKKGDVIMIGTDGAPTALQSIRDGWLTLTVGVPAVEQVYSNWQYMDQVLSGKPVQAGSVKVKEVPAEIVNETWGPTLYLPGQIIDKNNVDDKNLWGNIPVKVQP